MTDVKSTLPGFFPRPPSLREELKRIGGLQKEGMEEKTKREINDLINESRSVILELQEENNINYGVEGQLFWDDLLAYPATQISGFEMTGLIRYFNTNRFYRKPVLKKELEIKRHFSHDENELVIKNSELKIKPILTGPFTLFDLSKNEFYNSDDLALQKITEVICKELNKLNELNPEIIQIDDPSLTKRKFNAIDEIYEEIISSTNASIIVNSYFGDLSKNFTGIVEKVDGVGMDLVNYDKNWELIKDCNNLDILQAGLIDAKNTKLEKKEVIQRKIEEILDMVNLNELLVSTNLYLDFLPWSIMKEKIKLIGSLTGGSKSD